MPIYTRSQMLAWLKIQVIAVSGSLLANHGCLIGYILDQAGFDPTVINGGRMKQYDNNLKRAEISGPRGR